MLDDHDPARPRLHPYPSGNGGRTGTSTYSALLAQVKDHGLLRRRTGFYWSLFGGLVATLALAWVAFSFLGDSWFQLIVAGVLGVLFTQFAFLSHEAAHRQVFASQKWNDHAGRWVGTFLVGLSYSWWMNKHTVTTATRTPSARTRTSSRTASVSCRRTPLRPRGRSCAPS